MRNPVECVEIAMSQQIGFDEVIDAAERLDPDAQAELVAVLSRRIAERERTVGVCIK